MSIPNFSIRNQKKDDYRVHTKFSGQNLKLLSRNDIQPMKSVPNSNQPMEMQNMTTEMTQQSAELEGAFVVETVLYFLQRNKTRF